MAESTIPLSSPPAETEISASHKKWSILPVQLPRHASRPYFILRLLTAIFSLLSICLHAATIAWEVSVHKESSDNHDYHPYIHNYELDSQPFLTIFALGPLVATFIVSILDLYRQNYRRGTIIGIDSFFGFILLGLSITNPMFWDMVYAPINEDDGSGSPLYKFGIFALSTLVATFLTLFCTWFINIFATRNFSPTVMLPTLRPRHRSLLYFRIRIATAISLLLSILLHLSLATYESYLAVFLDRRIISCTPLIIFSLLFQIGLFVILTIDLYAPSFPHNQLVGWEITFWVLSLILGLVNLGIWHWNYYPAEDQYCSWEGEYGTETWYRYCPSSHPAEKLYPFGMAALAWALVGVCGSAAGWFGNLRVRKSEVGEAAGGDVELQETK